MITKNYDFNGDIYSVVACTKEDIPSHTERVLSYWKETNTSIPTQFKLLEDCIEEDTAYKLIDANGVSKAGIYLQFTKIDEARCYFMFLENKRMLAMLFHYLRTVTNINVVLFTPHDKKFIPFKFLMNEISIRMWINTGVPIRIGTYSKQGQALYEDHFLRYGIKEL